MIEIRLILTTVQIRQVPLEGDCLARERIEMRFAIEYQRLLETLCDNMLSRRSQQRHQKLLSDLPCRGHRDDTVPDRGLRVVLTLVWIAISIFDTPILSLGDGNVTLETFARYEASRFLTRTIR